MCVSTRRVGRMSAPTARCNRLRVERERIVFDAWGWRGGAIRLERDREIVTSSPVRDDGTLCAPFVASPGDVLVWSPPPADPDGEGSVLDGVDGLLAAATSFEASVLRDLMAGDRRDDLSEEEALRRTARAAFADWMDAANREQGDDDDAND